MVGPNRTVVLALALGVALAARPGLAEDPKPQTPTKPADAPAEPARARPSPSDFTLPGEDAPAPFVPKTPRTVAEQKKVEATRLYAEARALEGRGELREAIALLEKALDGDPDSIPILRRLIRLNAPLGRFERAVEYGRRVLAAEPGDVGTVNFMVEFYKTRKRDVGKAEALLKEVLASPKLDKASPAATVLQFELAGLYASLRQFDKAVEPLTKVVDALDDKAARQLPIADQRRILGADEANAYIRFALIFGAANRPELAIRCLKRAEVYDDENGQIPLLLAESYLDAGRADDALAQVEKALKRLPQGRLSWERLSLVITRLRRDKEIIPRLEAAAKLDAKNLALRSLLVDRYRMGGMNDKADALAKTLLQDRPDVQGFATQFAQLLKDKKTEDLLRLLEKTTTQLGRVDAIGAQVDAVAADPAYAGTVLDAGLAMLRAKPPRLGRDSWNVLFSIATKAKKGDKIVDLLRWMIGENPDPIVYRELINRLSDLNRHAEAEAELEALMARFPEERNPQTLLLLGQVRIRANKEDAAIAVLKEVLKKVPNDPDATRLLAFALSQKGSFDEAVVLLRDALKNDPANIELIRSLGIVFQQGGKNDESLAYFKSLVEKYPNNDEVVKYARSNLSLIYTNLGDYAKGESELEVLYAKDPNDAGINNDLGYLYAEQGKNLEKAEAMIRKAVTEDAENSAYLDSLGWVLFKRGKTKEAIAPLEKAIEHLNFPDAAIHEHLGDVYFELKDRAKAKAAWEKAEKVALEAKPPDKHLAEVRKKLDSLKKLAPSPSPAGGANP